MRTAPAAQIALAESASYSTHKRVRVKNGSGTWINLSALQGYNWIDEAEYTEDIDAPATASIILFREVGALSLAPFLEASALNRLDDGVTYSPLLDLARELQIEGATLAAGASPASGDWQIFFHGYIDEIDWPDMDSRAMLVCTDRSARLRDTLIETPATYAAAGGIAVETVAQSILTDNATGDTLYTPSSPGFNITRYTPAGVSVLESLQRLLNDTTGWPVRYKYDAGTSAFRLTLVDPQRSKTTPDKTLPASFYSNVTQLSITLQGIRTKWRTFYTDASTGLRASVVASDATAMARYGGFHRTAEIEEASDSPIDSAAEATRMNDAALADTKDPKASMEIESLWYPWTELNDLIRFTANGIHFDSDQDLAVVGIRHRLGPVLDNGEQEDLTYLRVRGSPAGQYTRWLAKDSRIPNQSGTQTVGGTGYPVLALQSMTDTAATVRVTAANTVGLVEYAYRIFGLNTAAGAFSAWAALGAFQDVVVTRGNKRINVLEVKVRDANGESFTVPFYVDPLMPQVDDTTGGVTRSIGSATLISSVVSKLQNDGDLAPNINADGDVFIPSTNRAKIGASGTPSTVTIPNRINFGEFTPATKNEDYDASGDYLANSVGNLLNVGLLRAPLILPEGAVLTEITPRWYAYDNANANVALRLDRINNAGAATNLATLSDSTTGWHGSAFSMSETISSSDVYMFELSVSAAIIAGARFLWVEYKYTIDDYLKRA